MKEKHVQSHFFGLEVNSAMLFRAEQPIKLQKSTIHLTNTCYKIPIA